MERRTTYRRLAFDFSVRCDDRQVAGYVARVLGRFAIDDGAGDAMSFEVVDAGEDSDVSRYRLLRDGEWMVGSNNLSVVLDDFFARVNVETVKATNDLVLVHAGAVVTPRGVGVLLPAPSGSGKSTLVAGLVRAGFGYLSDEAAVLDPPTGLLHPYPVALSLKGSSRDRFPEGRPDPADAGLTSGAWHVDPDAIRAGAVAAACEVGFVIPHRYEAGADLRLEPLTPAEACVELAGNLMLGRRDTPRSLEPLAALCRGSRGYRLTHGALDDAVTTIAELTSA